MKREILASLTRQLKDLRDYIVASESMLQINKINTTSLDGDAAETIRSAQAVMLSPAKAAQFLYSTVIVGLYGCLEVYVEQLVEEFVNQLNRLAVRYPELPERLRSNHRRLSGLLADRIEGSGNAATLTVADIIANLHSCFSGDEIYLINARAFTHHTANLRVPVVGKMFTDAGADKTIEHVRADPRFKTVIDDVDPGTADMFFRINDLADRRNEVAHGIPSELLSPSLLMEYITVIDAFCQSLFEATVISIMPYAQDVVAVGIGTPYRVLRSGHVACFELPPAGEIHVNDTLVAYSGDIAFRSGPILSLQIDGVDLKHVKAHAAVLRVGIGLDFKCKASWSCMVLSG